jgi:hypothetical protein
MAPAMAFDSAELHEVLRNQKAAFLRALASDNAQDWILVTGNESAGPSYSKGCTNVSCPRQTSTVWSAL